jgi:prevent-host-death family protein
MRTVSVTELKANLSRYLDLVQRGSEVQVLERGVPIARLVAVEAGLGRGKNKKEENEKLSRLERSGILRRGTGDARWVLEQEPLKLPGPSVLGALLEDREDRF